MAVAEAAVGALIGAAAGGVATYVAERKLARQREAVEARLRRQALADDTAAAREAHSRAAAVDILEALWVLAAAKDFLRWVRLPFAGASDKAERGHFALDRIKHALAVSGPQLGVLALREQLDEVVLLASEYAYGEWSEVHTTTQAREAHGNRAMVDFENFVAWSTKMFEAYVDGSWTTFEVAARPVLARPELEQVWVPPDEV